MGCGASTTSQPTAAEEPTTHETAWAPVVDAWLADAVDGAPDVEVALAEAAGACLAAAEKAPCARCDGRFAEQWGDAPWHCFKCREPLDTVRAAPERVKFSGKFLPNTQF